MYLCELYSAVYGEINKGHDAAAKQYKNVTVLLLYYLIH